MNLLQLIHSQSEFDRFLLRLSRERVIGRYDWLTTHGQLVFNGGTGFYSLLDTILSLHGQKV